MSNTAADLPDDVETLQAMVLAMRGETAKLHGRRVAEMAAKLVG